MSELEEIRKALDLTQEEFAPLLGAKAHSTYNRWENSPNTPSGRDALERAKAIYKKKKGKEWAGPAPAVTREEFDRLRDDVEDAAAVIQFLLSQVPAGSRPGVLPKRFRGA